MARFTTEVSSPTPQRPLVCSCGNRFDADNLCMVSACQWEGTVEEPPARPDGPWFVADEANPERRDSLLDPDNYPPEFGPFPTRDEAQEFAATRPAYRLVPPRSR